MNQTKIKLCKDLTKLYITWLASKYFDSSRELVSLALIEAQTKLSFDENKVYVAWHKRTWPDLDW